MKLSRKIRRKKEKQIKKDLEKDFSEKLNMFDALPEKCLTCEDSFDKKNKEMVSSWRVVVSEERVRLYCPECWETAQSVIKEYFKEKKNA